MMMVEKNPCQGRANSHLSWLLESELKPLRMCAWKSMMSWINHNSFFFGVASKLAGMYELWRMCALILLYHRQHSNNANINAAGDHVTMSTTRLTCVSELRSRVGRIFNFFSVTAALDAHCGQICASINFIVHFSHSYLSHTFWGVIGA